MLEGWDASQATRYLSFPPGNLAHSVRNTRIKSSGDALRSLSRKKSRKNSEANAAPEGGDTMQEDEDEAEHVEVDVHGSLAEDVKEVFQCTLCFADTHNTKNCTSPTVHMHVNRLVESSRLNIQEWQEMSDEFIAKLENRGKIIRREDVPDSAALPNAHDPLPPSHARLQEMRDMSEDLQRDLDEEHLGGGGGGGGVEEMDIPDLAEMRDGGGAFAPAAAAFAAEGGGGGGDEKTKKTQDARRTTQEKKEQRKLALETRGARLHTREAMLCAVAFQECNEGYRDASPSLFCRRVL